MSIKIFLLSIGGRPLARERLLLSLLVLWALAGIPGCMVNEKASEPIPPETIVALLEQGEFPRAEVHLPSYQLLGRFQPKDDVRFLQVPDTYTRGSARGKYLHRRALEAYVQMAEAAQEEGIQLHIISATRNFDSQKRIWESKWKGLRIVEGQNLAKEVKDPVLRAQKILRFSSMPGTSRHHWGTDMDFNALSNRYFEEGEGAKVYEWLQAHGSNFGFGQPYTVKDSLRPVGYEEEKWHWSYLPLAKLYLSEYQKQIKNTDIKEFAGSEVAFELAVIRTYVEGIHPDCQ
ncbi:MAG: M15 family metallopeptidase [Bacteroidota bacterium]